MDKSIEKALDIAWEYGQIDGDHHAKWVLDQMVRVLLKDEKEYENWVRKYENNGEYEWSIGIAP